MIKIAIVEDNKKEQQRLLSNLERYGVDNHLNLRFFLYGDAITFLEERGIFDIVFMDIMLPNMTGMEAAQRLREYDKQVVLIFVTTMAQFAIKGYEVEALDYIIKPVKYDRLTMKLQKAIKVIQSNEGGELTINDPSGIVKCSTAEVMYVEVHGHKLKYHTTEKIYEEYRSLTELEKVLKVYDFMRCNACFLVNPQFIKKVNGKELTVLLFNGEELRISQPRRKSFIGELTNWLGQGKK
ncbi:MAG: response regulator transcription factor [Clostridia bacterium]|nr:response regulator transcription factor [Clostridia bacterium]